MSNTHAYSQICLLFFELPSFKSHKLTYHLYHYLFIKEAKKTFTKTTTVLTDSCHQPADQPVDQHEKMVITCYLVLRFFK